MQNDVNKVPAESLSTNADVLSEIEEDLVIRQQRLQSPEPRAPASVSHPSRGQSPKRRFGPSRQAFESQRC